MPSWVGQLGHVWWSCLTRDTGRYVVFTLATWALLSVILKEPLRSRKIRANSPSAGQMVMEFAVSIRSIAIFATVALGMNLLAEVGAYPLANLALHMGPLWFWASLALMIVGHDTYYYWTHRAMHRFRLLRAVHRFHHRSVNPSPFTAYSFDLGEAAMMAAFVVVWPFVVPTAWPVIPLFMIHQIARNTLAHCGYELMLATADGRPMFDWLTTTTHHDLHHVRAGSNFGLYFTFWDRWMGTEDPDYYAAFARASRTPLPANALTAHLARRGVLSVLSDQIHRSELRPR